MEEWQFYAMLAVLPIPNLFGIVHAFFRNFPGESERLIWMGVCVFVPVIGGLAYLLFGLRRASRPQA